MHTLCEKQCIFDVYSKKKYIRIGMDNNIQIFTWGGISSYIMLEIMFYGSSDTSP